MTEVLQWGTGIGLAVGGIKLIRALVGGFIDLVFLLFMLAVIAAVVMAVVMVNVGADLTPQP